MNTLIGMSEHPSASEYKKLFIHLKKNIGDNVECVFLIKNVDGLFCDRLETFNKKNQSFHANSLFKTMKYFTTTFLSHNFESMILEKM